MNAVSRALHPFSREARKMEYATYPNEEISVDRSVQLAGGFSDGACGTAGQFIRKSVGSADFIN